MVQLAKAVTPAADQRLDLAGVRIQRDQRYLGVRRGFLGLVRNLQQLSGLAGRLPPLALLEQFVHVLHSNAHGVYRRPLQVQVECRIHAIRVCLEIVVLKTALQFLVDQVNEIRRVQGLRNAFRQVQRALDGNRIITIGDVRVLPHQR